MFFFENSIDYWVTSSRGSEYIPRSKPVVGKHARFLKKKEVKIDNQAIRDTKHTHLN